MEGRRWVRAVLACSLAAVTCALAPAGAPAAVDRDERLLPDHRIVGLYGMPGKPTLGALGRHSWRGAHERVRRMAAEHRTTSRPTVRAYEAIATLATDEAGRDGAYSRPVSLIVLAGWLDQARRADARLIVDLQPGRADALEQARALEPLLREPDVHLALDPEWELGPGQRHRKGRVGSMSGREIDRIAAWLDDLAAEEGLAQKLLLVHRFQASMVREPGRIGEHERVAVVMSMDGHGTRGGKRARYEDLAATTPDLYGGMMLFQSRDSGGLFTPFQLRRLDPAPDLIFVQ